MVSGVMDIYLTKEQWTLLASLAQGLQQILTYVDVSVVLTMPEIKS